MLTPSNIPRFHPDPAPVKCGECAQDMRMVPRYPEPPEHRCVTRGCKQNAYQPTRIPTGKELGLWA